MADYYQILGVPRTANESDIKKAYRKLAMKHHPDRGGDSNTFQHITEAYETLSDPAKRAQYDNPIPESAYGFNHDPFGHFFRDLNRRAQQQRDARIGVWISLEDAVNGGKKIISLTTPAGPVQVEIRVPPGVNNTEAIRYPGLAGNGRDLVVEFRVHGHPTVERDNLNLWTSIELDFWKLILGTTITIKTLQGKQVKLTVPPLTKPEGVLRLQGHGIKRDNGNPGHLFIQVKATMPTNIPQDLIDAIKKTQE